MVAAAVILHRTRLPVRIDDSKRLSPRQRARAFDVILRHAEVGVGIVPAETIDARNILQATFLAMRQAVADLPSAPARVLVDGNAAPPSTVGWEPIVGGDATCYVISCASIVAKVVRDRLMEFYHDLNPEYGFDRHKGYGTALHAGRLQLHGPSLWHRHSFEPVKYAAAAGPGG